MKYRIAKDAGVLDQKMYTMLVLMGQTPDVAVVPATGPGEVPSLLKPKVDGATRDTEDVDEPDASFWGTTMLRVETRR